MDDVKRVNRELKYKGKILEIYQDTMQFSNGNTSKWDFVHHRGAAAVVAVTDEGKILMVTQYRPGMERVSLEIPAGCLEPNEDPIDTAARELEEETGYKCGEISHLIDSVAAAAYDDEKVYIYLAKNLKKTKQNLDPNEFLNVYEYSVDELLDKIQKNEINDSKTIGGILTYYIKTIR